MARATRATSERRFGRGNMKRRRPDEEVEEEELEDLESGGGCGSSGWSPAMGRRGTRESRRAWVCTFADRWLMAG